MLLKRPHGRYNSTKQGIKLTEQFTVGDKLLDYRVINSAIVSELNLEATLLEHDTGARHLHVSRADSDNVFGVAFRTPPMNNSGVPHILEHVTLCGSKKFPVRDPFFKMLNRSLATFMNAFTGPDWTMYPFSTQNEQDFNNLLQVYLDAAFYPKLTYHDFLQEGWRLDFKNKEDLELRGVVYNEMKGVYGSRTQVYSQALQNYLLPVGTYGVVSGGDPQHIPSLSWAELKQFHKDHYQPANAFFYTFGDLPLIKHLTNIQKYVLDNYKPKSMKLEVVKKQPRWSEVRTAHIKCAIDPLCPNPTTDNIVSSSYLLNEISELDETFSLSMLGELLLSGENAPFYKNLIEKGLGGSYAPSTEFNCQLNEAFFSVGLQRVDETNIKQVFDVIDSTFKESANAGFSEERVESLLHSIRLSQQHVVDKFGLNLIISLLPSWIHGTDPTEAIQMNQRVKKFKESMKSDQYYLQNLIKKYFISNTHRLNLVATPHINYEKEMENKESEMLVAMVKKMDANKMDELRLESDELLNMQMIKPDVECLPTLHIQQINSDYQHVQVQKLPIKSLSTPLHFYAQPTNGVSYVRISSSANNVPDYLRPFLTFFSHIITKVGAGQLNYQQQAQKIELKTGGINAKLNVVENSSDSKLCCVSLNFSTFCLDENLEDTIQLLVDIFKHPHLQIGLDEGNERLKVLLEMQASHQAQDIASDAHRYAMSHSSSCVSAHAAISNQLHALPQLNLIQKLSTDVSNGLVSMDSIVEKLHRISALLLHSPHMRVAANSQQNMQQRITNVVDNFARQIITEKSSPSDNNVYVPSESIYEVKQSKANSKRALFKMPFQVRYVSKSFPSVCYEHVDHAPLTILSRLLSSKYLHEHVRERGGAYGGGAQASPSHFDFYSYRDPNLSQTLQVFDDSISWARDGSFSDTDVSEAQLATFQRVDAPVAPGQRGTRSFVAGISEGAFAAYRKRLLGVKKEDLVRVAREYLKGEGAVCVLGSPERDMGDRWTVHEQLD